MNRPHEEYHSSSLVKQYEQMVKNNSITFLETEQFLNLIEHYETLEQFDKALVVTEHAIQQHAYTSTFYTKKAQFLLASGQEHEALNCLDKADSLNSNDVEIYLLRAEAFAGLNLNNEALEVLEHAEKIVSNEEWVEVLKIKAAIYEASGSFKKSFDTLSEALQRDPDEEDLLSRIWLNVEMSGLFKESAELHRQLVDKAPYAKLVWYNCGHALFNLGEYGEAADCFEYAYLIDEAFEAAYTDRALCLFKLGLYEKALECYEMALDYIEPEAEIYTHMGECFELLDNPADAESFYLEAIRINPGYAEAYFRLGECLFKREKWIGAKGAYEAAFCLNKKADYLSALGETHYQLNDHEKALFFFQNASDMAPDECDKWIRLATFHMALGDYDTALETLDEASMYNECQINLNYCKVACLYQSGRKQEALNILQHTLNEDKSKRYNILFQLAPELQYADAFMATINTYSA